MGRSKPTAASCPPPIREGLLAADGLARHLQAGGRPTAMESPIPLFPGETLHSWQPFSLLEFAGRVVPYNRVWFGIGSPLLFATTLGISALVNSAAKSRAEAEAAAAWRPVNQGSVFVTSHRFGLQGVYGWNDIEFAAIRNSYLDPFTGLVIFLNGANPYKLILPWPEYHFLLFQYLAYGRVVPFGLPADLLPADRTWPAPPGLPGGPPIDR